jgi:hypothetical protein
MSISPQSSASSSSSSSKFRVPVSSLPDSEIVAKFQALAIKSIKEIAHESHHQKNLNVNAHKVNNSWKLNCPLCSHKIGVSVTNSAIVMSNFRSHLRENHAKFQNVTAENEEIASNASSNESDIEGGEDEDDNESRMSIASASTNTNARPVLSNDLQNEIRSQLQQTATTSSANIVVNANRSKRNASTVR